MKDEIEMLKVIHDKGGLTRAEFIEEANDLSENVREAARLIRDSKVGSDSKYRVYTQSEGEKRAHELMKSLDKQGLVSLSLDHKHEITDKGKEKLKEKGKL